MKILKYISITSLSALLVAAYIYGKPLWDANERIDRCFDDYSPAYIHDDAARAAACAD